MAYLGCLTNWLSGIPCIQEKIMGSPKSLLQSLGLGSIISDRQDLCCTNSSTRFWEIFENLKKCEIYKTYEQMGERGYWVGEHNGEGDC